MLLEVKNLTFAYNGRNILKDLEFSLDDGEIAAVVGPNGSGKTTFLKCLHNLLEPSAGTIMLDGKDIDSYSHRGLARIVGRLPQQAPDDVPFTSREVVLIGRTPYLGWFGQEKKKDIEIVRWAMDVTDTEDLADREFNRLSGGEKQRVMLAKVLAQQPRLLLLDEPSAHLDLHHQVEILERISELHQELKMAVIFVSHDINLAALYGFRIDVLAGGNIQASGRPDQIINAAQIRDIFKLDVEIIQHPTRNVPQLLINQLTNDNHLNKF